MKRILAATFALALTPFGAHAQDICSGLLSYTGRDISSEARQNAIAADLYTQHCEGSSARQGSSTSVGLDAVVKAIPIKFNYGGASSSEKLNNFCKVYDSRRAEFSAEVIDTSTVVRESLEAFNTCVGLSVSGIYFNPKIGRTILVVDVRRGSDDAAVTGVTYDPNLLECKLPPLPASKDAAAEPATVADANTVRPLDGSYLPITCARKPQDGASGEKNYPRAELTIGTSRGSFFMAVPQDAELPLNYASEISARMESLDKNISAANGRNLTCDVATASDQKQYPSATALIPEDKRAAYVLAGGGCAMNDFRETGHNGTQIQSRPNEDRTGWYCFAGDPPNIPLPNLRVTAYAVYCTVR